MICQYCGHKLTDGKCLNPACPGRLRRESMSELKPCPLCGNPVNFEDFRDDLSRREFKISGLCQKCQDEVFGGGNEE